VSILLLTVISKIVSDHPDANRKKDLKEEEYYFHVTDLAGRGYDYTKDEALKAYQRQLRNPFLPPNISGYKKHQFTNINAPSLNWTTFEVEQQVGIDCMQGRRYAPRSEDRGLRLIIGKLFNIV